MLYKMLHKSKLSIQERVFHMNNQKSHALTGTHNQRINKTFKSDNEAATAWNGAAGHAPKSNVTIPSSSAVEHAKEWVDNGSRL